MIGDELAALGGEAIRPFDVHSHTGADIDGSTRTAGEHVRDLAPLGGRSVIFPFCVNGGYETENLRVVEECRRHPDRLVPFARLDPKLISAADAAGALEAGARGFKLHPRAEDFQLDHPGVEVCPPLRLPDHEFDGRELDRGGGVDRFFAHRDTRHEACSERCPESPGMARRWSVRLLESIIGPRLVKRTFWFFATVFIFILSANWMGLIPGVDTIGWGHRTPDGFVIDQPLFRGANADLNMTLAMALVFFACWIVWALQEVGLGGFVRELFGPKGASSGVLRVVMIVVFFAAGCLEIVSILFRPISLSFRLYGNIFAGETMLETMSRLVPGLGWLLPVPFYFMELLVGLVQALVFMLLCAVFTLLMCQHEEKGPSSPHG